MDMEAGAWCPACESAHVLVSSAGCFDVLSGRELTY